MSFATTDGNVLVALYVREVKLRQQRGEEIIVIFKALGAVACLTVMAIPSRADTIDISGFYLGGTLLKGTSSSIQTWENNGLDPEIDDFRPNSPQVGAFGGYNFIDGSTLFGLEFDVRTDTTKEKQDANLSKYEAIYPQQYGYGSGGLGHSFYSSYEGGLSRSDRRQSYSYEETFSPTLSARVGHQINNVLLFARAGAGGALISEKITDDDSGSVYCGQTQTFTAYDQFGNFKNYMVGCSNPYAGKVQVKERDSFRPTATLALGAEYHFEKMFARVEGELRHIFLDDKLLLSPSDGATRYAISTSIGFRF